MTHSPEETVHSYIQAYFDWNNRSDARTNLVIDDDVKYKLSMKVATDEYQQILDRLCVNRTVTYTTNFGDNPLHDPKSETIESVDVRGMTALVRTRDVYKFGPLVSYEYHLVQEEGQWRISKLLYVDEIGADDCL